MNFWDVNRYFMKSRDVSGTFRLNYEVQRKLTRYNKTPSNQRFVLRDLTRYKQITETEDSNPRAALATHTLAGAPLQPT